MRYIYVILTVLILSSACNAQSSPNAPPAATLPASPNTPPITQSTVQQPTTTTTIATAPATTLNSGETICVERDAYKQVIEAHQKTLETIKWAVGIIGSLLLILVGYIVFKNNKEYKDALDQAKEAKNDAKEACKEARHWEAEAKQILGSIDKQVKAELETIEKRGKESIREIIDQTQKERRISELWNSALRLGIAGKYEEACNLYAELNMIKPGEYWAYNNWGVVLAGWAGLKGDEKLFEQASQKFEQAIKTKSDNHESYFNWGTTLSDWAEFKGDERLFEQACQKFEQSVKIKPDKDKAYHNWGNTLISWAKLKTGTAESEVLIKRAEEKCLKAESLKQGIAAYNLACIYVLRGDKEQCRKWLLIGQEARTLPTRDHAMKDKDLESVKNEAWFKEIKWKGE